jgi:glutamate synthase domain-containing protein 3
VTANPGPVDATISVPEIRDFDRINAELIQRLDFGARRIVLAGVGGQRLLASRLVGSWDALIEVEGNAGPELAAELDAPGLTVVVRGNVADGAGRGLVAGRLIVTGSASDGLGYTQTGGTIVVHGSAGHRAGLMQAGGSLIIVGAVGRLAAERQTGGVLIVHRGRLGPHERRGATGGRMVLAPLTDSNPPGDHWLFDTARRDCGEWLPEGAFDAG